MKINDSILPKFLLKLYVAELDLSSKVYAVLPDKIWSHSSDSRVVDLLARHGITLNNGIKEHL
jgi:hypothetical protein